MTMSNPPELQLRVARKRVEAQDICSFELVEPQGRPLPAFTAGAHLDVRASVGTVRQYSLCQPFDQVGRYVIAVLREPASRGGSRAMHDDVREGDLLTVSAPKNHFELAPGARKSLLLAGGIGVTPILCMAETLARTGAAFEMHYCVRSRERAAFVGQMQAAAFASSVHLHCDDGPAEQRVDLQAILDQPDEHTHLYVCGPKGFMDATLSTARAKGWTEDRIHFEYFSAEVVKSTTDADFDVVLASSGRVLHVTRDQTVVQALAAAGVEVPTSCEQGVCGTCLTRVIEGVPDHKDMYLTPAEQALNDQFTPCCSRAKSKRLVLDL